jgi:predicted transcriptional regulator
MAISNELSSEIAAAMLAAKKSPEELKRLSEIVVQVHNALQKMSEREVAEALRATDKRINRVAGQNRS